MEYYKNLLIDRKKSKYQIFFGIIFILISLLWIADRILEHNPIRIFDWMYGIIFFLNGIVHIIEGTGTSVNNFFGKAFIKINDNEIIFKPKIVKEKIHIYWEDVEKIAFGISRIKIINKDNILNLNYSSLDFKNIQTIKNYLTEISKSKNILIESKS